MDEVKLICLKILTLVFRRIIIMIESIQLKVEENFQSKLGKPSKKKIKSVDFFHTGAGGGQPQIHTFLKVWIFKGGWGSWV